MQRRNSLKVPVIGAFTLDSRIRSVTRVTRLYPFLVMAETS